MQQSVLSVVFSQRGFSSPVGGSECSQVGRAGCGGACVPLAQALPCCVVWKPDVERSGAHSDRVAAGQLTKVPVAALPPLPAGALLSGPTEPHDTGDTLTHRSAGRGSPGDPTLTHRLGLRWKGKVELKLQSLT